MKDGMDFSRYEYPVARREHKCDFCGAEIPKGEQYVREIICDGGDFWDSKYHEQCFELIDRYYRWLDRDEYVDFGELTGLIYDNVCSDCTDVDGCDCGRKDMGCCPVVHKKFLVKKEG